MFQRSLSHLKKNLWEAFTFVFGMVAWIKYESLDFLTVIMIPLVIWLYAKATLDMKPHIRTENGDTVWQVLMNTRWSIKDDLHLHEHGSFWLPIFLFAIIALWAGLFSTEFNLKALTEPQILVEALKLPVTLFALCIPFTVAIGRFHASAQRDKSNREAQEVKSFKHYYEHREQFVKHMAKFKFSDMFQISDPLALYQILFPNASRLKFDIQPSEEANRRIRILLNSLETDLFLIEESLETDPDLELWDDSVVTKISACFGLVEPLDLPLEEQHLSKYNRYNYLMCGCIRRLLAHAEAFEIGTKYVENAIELKLYELGTSEFPNLNRYVSRKVQRAINVPSVRVT